MTAESLKDGLAIQKEIFGIEFPQRALDNTTPLTRPYHELLVSFTFGEVWKRDVFSRSERSLVTLAMLIALNRPDQIRTHVRGALNNGVPKEKIFELAIHALAYCGAPLAGSARNTIIEELQKLGLEPAPAQPAIAPTVKK
ncbi:MAG TPA: carboxymuconolactone decarboxylase family protein [Stellaceae bacterium]|nr:carboxymuconolactone decarboxylase family protein [Stellaceae bacterium]